MLAADLWSLNEEGERLHPAMEAVVRRSDSYAREDPVAPAEVSDVLRQLADDEVLIRRGLELAEDLQHFFRAAAVDSRCGDAAQLISRADLWAARRSAYARGGAWTVWRAMRVAYHARLAAAAAKQAAAERSRAERLLTVRAAVELALTKRAGEEQRRSEEEQRRAEEEQRRAEEEQRRAEEQQRRAEEQQRRTDEEQRCAEEQQRIEAERARAERALVVRAAVERALAKRAEEWAFERKLAVVVGVAATTDLVAACETAAGTRRRNDATDGDGCRATPWTPRGVRLTLSGAAGGIDKQRSRLPRSQHGELHATTSGPGPPCLRSSPLTARPCRPTGQG